MSKGNLFFGNARGKLGETVFYRAGGEQRNRTYIKKIKNPKTIAQMTQRILTLNPISMFKNMKPIISESFTERKSNQSSYNKFVQENSSSKKFFITKAMLEQNMCVPYGAVIAKGSLGLNLEPQFAMIEDVDMTQGYAIFDCAFDAKKLTDFSGLSGTGAVALSGANLVRVLRQTSVVELPTKFTVVLVEGVPQDFELESGEIVNPWKLAYKVIHVDGDTYTENIYGCPEAMLEGSLFILPQNMEAALSADNPAAHIGINLMGQTADEAIVHPMGIILSFEEDGVLKVSNSTITSNYKNIGTTPVRSGVAYFLKGSLVYKQAMEEYGYSTGGTLNAQSLAVANVSVIFQGSQNSYTVNGEEPKSGEYKVGESLVFKPLGAADLSITVNDGAAVTVNNGSEWTYVVEDATEILIEVEAAE